jgi:hypothetical protein
MTSEDWDVCELMPTPSWARRASRHCSTSYMAALMSWRDEAWWLLF